MIYQIVFSHEQTQGFHNDHVNSCKPVGKGKLLGARFFGEHKMWIWGRFPKAPDPAGEEQLAPNQQTAGFPYLWLQVCLWSLLSLKQCNVSTHLHTLRVSLDIPLRNLGKPNGTHHYER